MKAYRHLEVIDAMIIWEAILEDFLTKDMEDFLTKDAKHQDNYFAQFREKRGSCELRDHVLTDIVPLVQHAYSKLEDEIEGGFPYDFEFVPGLLHHLEPFLSSFDKLEPADTWELTRLIATAFVRERNANDH